MSKMIHAPSEGTMKYSKNHMFSSKETIDSPCPSTHGHGGGLSSVMNRKRLPEPGSSLPSITKPSPPE